MPKKKIMPEIITRGEVGQVEVRDIDEKTRTATFVAATENGVDTYIGREVLRMSGMDTTRYVKNPTVIDSHLWEQGIQAIVGNSKISTEDRKLIAEITFAEVERGEMAWQLVKTGFLKTLSVGFQRKKWLDIEDDESDGEGESKIDGPARIVTKWSLMEISVVPLPADEDALKRKFMEWREREMAEDTEAGTAAEGQAQVKDAQAPPAVETEKRTAEVITEAPPQTLRRDAIMDMAPDGLEALRDRCIAEGRTVEEARGLLLAELAKRTKPVGTPPPPDAETQGEGEVKLKDVPDKIFVRSLTG